MNLPGPKPDTLTTTPCLVVLPPPLVGGDGVCAWKMVSVHAKKEKEKAGSLATCKGKVALLADF